MIFKKKIKKRTPTQEELEHHLNQCKNPAYCCFFCIGLNKEELKKLEATTHIKE